MPGTRGEALDTQDVIIGSQQAAAREFNLWAIAGVSKITRLPWPVACLVMSLLVGAPGLFYVALTRGLSPDQVKTYLIGTAVVTTTAFDYLVAGRIFYNIASGSLPKIIYAIAPEKLFAPMTGWSDRFKARRQLPLMVWFGLMASLAACVAVWLVGGQTFGVQIAAGLCGLLMGVIAGSDVHLYFHFLAITPELLAGKVRLNTLYPRETTGLRALFSLTVDFTLVYFISNALVLSAVFVFAGLATSFTLKTILLASIIPLILIWAVAGVGIAETLMPMTRVVREQKDRTLQDLQAMIDAKYRALQSAESPKDQALDIEKLTALYNTVKSGSDLPVEVDSVSRFVASFLIPLLPLLLNLLFK